MTSRRRIAVLLLVIPGIAVLCAWLVAAYIHSDQILYYECMELSRTYARYVKDHDGALPRTFDDLIGERYLKRVHDDHGVGYVGPEPEAPEIIPVFSNRIIRDVDKFEFVYGGHTRDFEIRNDRVYRRDTNAEVIFVRPNRRTQYDSARRCSVKIAQLGNRD